jgi:hypothetical protein
LPIPPPELLSVEDLQRVMDSIADNQAYLSFNMSPVERILQMLEDSFHPKKPEAPFNLDICSRYSPKRMFNSFSSIYGSGYVAVVMIIEIVVSFMHCL